MKQNMFVEMRVRLSFSCLSIIVAFLLLHSNYAYGDEDSSREPRFRFPDGTSTESGVAGLVRRQLASQAAILGRLTGSDGGLVSGQTLRLAAGKGPFIGYVEIFHRDEWRVLCDPNQSWRLQEANVACRELGYEDGAAHFDHGNNTRLGDLRHLLSVNHEVLAVDEVECRGDEGSLDSCGWRMSGNRCDPRRHAVALVCERPSPALCPRKMEPFRDSCYEVHDSSKVSFESAQSACENQSGGHLVEIDDQAESDFLREWLGHQGKAERGNSYWTGGLVNSAAGRNFLFWHHTRSPVAFSRFVDEPQVHAVDGVASNGIQIRNYKDYFYWFSSPLNSSSSFICESPQLSIGCLSEPGGAGYNGSAARGESGQECLTWSTPGLTSIFPGQGGWTHNYCRNPDGSEEAPICYIEPDLYDYCQIPDCETVRRREANRNHVTCPPPQRLPDFPEISRSVTPSTSFLHTANTPTITLNNDNNNNNCGKEQYQCATGDCIFTSSVCDGHEDCFGGDDEHGCMVYEDQFIMERGFKLQGGAEPIGNIGVEECAKRCLQTKRCQCTSFSYNKDKRRCILGDRSYATSPYDALIERNKWNYYRLNTTFDNGCNRVKRPAGLPYEAIRLVNGRGVNIVEVKVNGTWGGICDDGFSYNEAHVVCRQLGYELGAEQVINGQGDDPTDLINVHDMECEGGERHISECHFGDHEGHIHAHACSGMEKAGLTCRKTAKTCEEHEFHCANKECIHINNVCDGINQCADGSDEDAEKCRMPLQVRLVGGESQTSGRIEVRHNGVWGTVCDDHFGQDEAKVFCRMMGYGDGIGARVYNGTEDLRGDGPVWIRFEEDKNCQGGESTVEQCKDRNLWRHDHHCSHAEDVAISCPEIGDSIDLYNSNNNNGNNNADAVFEVLPVATLHALNEQGEENTCGEVRVEVPPPDAIPRITGGARARAGAHPWQASLRVRGRDATYHWCGAAIVGRFHILTAAHCLREFPLATYFVRVGDDAIDIRDRYETEYGISRIHFHDNYNVGPYLNNDIALVEINPDANGDGIKFNAHVSPVCLPRSDVMYYQRGRNVTITGWGKVDYEGVDSGVERTQAGNVRHLREAQVKIISKDECTRPTVYGNDRLSPGMFCAGEIHGEGSDACQGDSGGPAVYTDRGKSTLIGITSWGYGCGRPNKPGVYTKVANYMAWIGSKMALRDPAS